MQAELGIKPSLENARAFERDAREKLKDLSGVFAWPTIALFVGVLVGLGTTSALAISGHLSYWAAVPINIVLIYAIFAALHEAVHDNIVGPRKSLRWLTLLIGHVSGFLLLAPYPGFYHLHLHHHSHTNDPVEDPDYWVKSDNYFVVILRCMAIQPAYIWHLYFIARDPVVMRAFVFEMAYVLSYFVIVAIAFQIGWGSEILLLWILPGYIAVVLCPLTFDWPVHHPHTERGRYTDSAILLFPKPVRWLFDAAFLGHTYHLIHHLYPRIPFYDYGTAYYRLAPAIAQTEAKIKTF